MATIYIDKKYSNLCAQLVDDKVVQTGEKIFNTYMDLSIFSAMIAMEKGRIPVENNGTEIPDRVFYNNQKEGLVYLIALLETKDPYVLKDDKQCWRIFQEYVNTGMSEISSWLIDNPTDDTGVDTLLNSIAEKASALLNTETQSGDIPEIDFF